MPESVTMLAETMAATDRAVQPDATTARGDARDAATDRTDRFVRLYQELFPPVHGYVRFRVRDVHAAEDLTAQVFERALVRLGSIRDPGCVRAWVFTIARNVVADYRRGQRAGLDLDSADELEHLWVDSPEGDALRREESRRLLAHLAELGDRERELIGLRFAAGLTNREIGEICGLSEANVAQIVHRAVVKLRRRFTTEEDQA